MIYSGGLFFRGGLNPSRIILLLFGKLRFSEIVLDFLTLCKKEEEEEIKIEIKEKAPSFQPNIKVATQLFINCNTVHY